MPRCEVLLRLVCPGVGESVFTSHVLSSQMTDVDWQLEVSSPLPRKDSHLLGDAGQCLETWWKSERCSVHGMAPTMDTLAGDCSWEPPESWPPRSCKEPRTPYSVL